MITVGSLFSGIGGIELGLQQAGGFETKWFVEKDKYAQAILRKHWPSKTIYSDITQVQWEKVQEVDVLTEGFPCQDISYAGKGAGIEEGTRSGLWKEYFKAIHILRPKIVFVENVSALLSRGLDIVLGDLASIGYDAEWDCIPASAVGAPHRRDRVWIIAYPNSGGSQKQPKKLEESVQKGEYRPTDTISSPAGALVRNDCWRTPWTLKSPILRVDDGVPNELDRIKCLGNAVVPQVAEFWAERIKEIFHERRQKKERKG